MGGRLATWNKRYFNGLLSPSVLQHLAALERPAQRPEVQTFLERAFRYMQQAQFPVTAFTVDLARQFGHIANMVQDAWQGIIPPFTLESRHQKIDDYIHKHPWYEANHRGTFLDIGSGFPPHTTVATAVRFPNWQVIGMDPALPCYLVQDEHGDYALFDENCTLNYFQGGSGRSLAVWRDPDSARDYFTGLFRQLLPQLATQELETTGTFGNSRAHLLKYPTRQYERPNLTFVNGRIGNNNLPKVHIIRCFNVLFYYNLAFRRWALAWFAQVLTDGGMVICGVNGFHSTRCRYTVYRKEREGLVNAEFAFSLDNVRPLGAISWSTFHDDDEEVGRLAQLVGVIRGDATFRQDFDARLDSLLTEYGLFRRGDDGYLQEISSEIAPEEREKRQYEIGERLDQEGYVTKAVSLLQRAGYQAWRNSAGHLAVSDRPQIS